MWSFASGLVLAAVLSGFTLWAMTAGTVTMVEKSDTISTLTEDELWHEFGSGATMDGPIGTELD